MTDASMSNQAAEPDRDVASSQQAQVQAPPNPGGSAMLDANIAASESTGLEAEALDNPIATNFSSKPATGDAKTAGASTLASPDSAEQEQSEKGTVHLQNNPNPPDK
jgi:hypothetical protein